MPSPFHCSTPSRCTSNDDHCLLWHGFWFLFQSSDNSTGFEVPVNLPSKVSSFCACRLSVSLNRSFFLREHTADVRGRDAPRGKMPLPRASRRYSCRALSRLRRKTQHSVLAYTSTCPQSKHFGMSISFTGHIPTERNPRNPPPLTFAAGTPFARNRYPSSSFF